MYFSVCLESGRILHHLRCYTVYATVQDGSDVKENVRKWINRCNADHRDKLLACGVLIVAELRMEVLKETEFTCSAGIAHNKVASKIFLLVLFQQVP